MEPKEYVDTITAPPLATIGDWECRAPAWSKGTFMLVTQLNPIFSVAEIGILNCSECGKPMRLACIEPDKPGFDLRTFECAKCSTGRTFRVAI
jgi:hypothetical protein